MGASHRRIALVTVMLVLLQVCAVYAALLWFSGGGDSQGVGYVHVTKFTDVRRENYNNSQKRRPPSNTSQSESDGEVRHGANATPGTGKQLLTGVATSETWTSAHRSDKPYPVLVLSPVGTGKQEERMDLQENGTIHGDANETGLQNRTDGSQMKHNYDESSVHKKEIRPLPLGVLSLTTHDAMTENEPNAYQKESTEELIHIMGRTPQRISIADSDKIFVSIKTTSQNTNRLFPSLLTWLQTIEGRQVTEHSNKAQYGT